MKYKNIVYHPLDTKYTEIAQRIAISFNYKLKPLLPQFPIDTNGLVMVFNPKELTVALYPEHKLFDKNYVVVTNVNDLNQAFNFPTEIVEDITIFAEDYSVTISNTLDTVSFYKASDNKVLTVPKDLVKKCFEKINKSSPIVKPEDSNKLPFVEFGYDGSIHDGYGTERGVRVTKMDDKYICGFEVYKGSLTHNSPMFKKYLVDKCTTDVKLMNWE